MIETADRELEALGRYAEIRERLLVDATKVSGLSQDDLGHRVEPQGPVGLLRTGRALDRHVIASL